MFEEFDQRVQTACTRLSHNLQTATGLTSYAIARLGIVISVLSIAIDALNYSHQFLSYKTSLFFVVIDGVCLLPLVWRSYALSKLESYQDSTAKPMEEMLLLMESSMFRRVWWMVTGFAVLFVPIFHSKFIILEFFDRAGYGLGILIFSYFALVRPLPPGKSKLKQWLTSLSAHLQPQPQPTN